MGDLEEEARFSEENGLISKLIVIADMGGRDIVTVSTDKKFEGVLSYEAYRDRYVFVWEYQKNLSGTNWEVRTQPDDEVVFHAREVKDRKPENPTINWEGFEYELLTFKRGPWLDHISELQRIAFSDPEEGEPYDSAERVRLRFGVGSPD
jgi:hypothetical protein